MSGREDTKRKSEALVAKLRVFQRMKETTREESNAKATKKEAFLTATRMKIETERPTKKRGTRTKMARDGMGSRPRRPCFSVTTPLERSFISLSRFCTKPVEARQRLIEKESCICVASISESLETKMTVVFFLVNGVYKRLLPSKFHYNLLDDVISYYPKSVYLLIARFKWV